MRGTMSWTRVVMAALCGLVLLSSSAWAGQVEHHEVQIVTTGAVTTVTGSLVGARFSDDPQQYLLCRVSILAPGAAPYMVCEAKDAAGNTFSCLSAEPAFINAVLGMSEYAEVLVDNNHPAGRCGTLIVGTISKHLPPSAP